MINKIIFSIIFLFSLVLISQVFAITAGQIPTSQDMGIQKVIQSETAEGLKGVVAAVVRWIYVIFFIIAVLFLLFAAYAYLTAKGDPETIKNVHNQLIYAAIAIVVALIAVSVDLIIKNFITTGGQGGGGTYWSKRYYPLGGDGVPAGEPPVNREIDSFRPY